MTKIALYLMTEKGLEVLRRLVSVDKNVISHAVIGIDPNLENDHSAEIETICKRRGITYYVHGKEPALSKNDYLFAVSWRWMIEHLEEKLVIFHDSLLPKYRGFSPLANMLINGEPRIGVSAIFGAGEYDRGYIIAQQHSDISYPMKIADAIQINKENYANLAEHLVRKITSSELLTATPQLEAEASYSIWRDQDDYLIDWAQSAAEIRRFVDAVGPPYSGAKTYTSHGDEVIVEDVVEVEDVACELRHSGKVIFVREGLPIVICGSGLLQIRKAYLKTQSGRRDYLPIKKFRTRFQMTRSESSS
jgi:methionyl-tRNA formyltransferase